MYAHVAVDDGSSRTFRIEGCRDVVPVDPACFVVVTHRFIGAEVLFADEIEVRLREALTHLHCRSICSVRFVSETTSPFASNATIIAGLVKLAAPVMPEFPVNSPVKIA